MTTTDDAPMAAPGAAAVGAVLLEADGVGKYFGSVRALSGVSLSVRAGQVTCVLGDNGAGKSTLIKILSGVFTPDEGEVRVDGGAVKFHSPRDALSAGIATVFQDLAMVPLMAIWRNFFLGSEPTRGWGPWRRFDVEAARTRTREGLAAMGIDLRDPDQPVGTLSGGERQSVAIARAVHFGARVLILDEPTSALGVKQAGVVLRRVAQARERGLGVVFITHNPHHAYPVGDRFVVLNRGRLLGDWAKGEIGRDDLVRLMSGGAELDALSHELERMPGLEEQAPDPVVAPEEQATAAATDASLAPPTDAPPAPTTAALPAAPEEDG
ncbi:ATP-binding cassette domain-containing protein [Catenulispora pinistramenti]|uniref:ATP-binding cassette domain-containing protein n=1 Tax=Catenulispora pinistramenti TaxID=2705254 RepID=UPI001E39F586|nr:ATP-binding cassette domain-containing protein [Catenulispora pinistramenti]